jgi:cyclopropane fatty-acyl-phospholipid synthase-like methyltransferase
MIKSSFLRQLNCLDVDLHPQSKLAVQCHDVDLVDISGAEWVPPTNKHHSQRPLQYQRALRHQQRHVGWPPRDDMTYSYPIWHPISDKVDYEETLQQAQMRKFDKIIQNARIKSTDHVLEIGTGWGSLAIRAVERRGVESDL